MFAPTSNFHIPVSWLLFPTFCMGVSIAGYWELSAEPNGTAAPGLARGRGNIFSVKGIFRVFGSLTPSKPLLYAEGDVWNFIAWPDLDRFS